MSKEKQIEKVFCDIECDEKFACFAEEPRIYESEEEHFNDIFAGYEADHQKALALIAWQEEQIKNLETIIKVYRSCLEHNNLDPKLYDSGWRKQSEWISVEERLPEPYTDVLTYDTVEFFEVNYLTKDEVWAKGVLVTHWMPLPEPPKMKGGAE